MLVQISFICVRFQFTKGRLLKNTLKETKAMLANAEYYVKTMEREREREPPSDTVQHMLHSDRLVVFVSSGTMERGSKYPKTEKKRIKTMLVRQFSLISGSFFAHSWLMFRSFLAFFAACFRVCVFFSFPLVFRSRTEDPASSSRRNAKRWCSFSTFYSFCSFSAFSAFCSQTPLD